jgi:hypothetical protein
MSKFSIYVYFNLQLISIFFLYQILGTLSVWYLYKNNIISSNVEGLKSPKKHKRPSNSSPSSSAKKRASFSEKLILMPELKFVFQLSSIDPHGK